MKWVVRIHPGSDIRENDAAVRLVLGRFFAWGCGRDFIGLKTFFEPLADPRHPADRGCIICGGVFDRAGVFFDAIAQQS